MNEWERLGIFVNQFELIIKIHSFFEIFGNWQEESIPNYDSALPLNWDIHMKADLENNPPVHKYSSSGNSERCGEKNVEMSWKVKIWGEAKWEYRWTDRLIDTTFLLDSRIWISKEIRANFRIPQFWHIFESP